MTPLPSRIPAPRRTTVLLMGVAALAAACGAELPTAAELQGMDVAAVESRVGKAVRLDSGTVRYFVNGVQVSAVEARRLSADSIATVEVRKVAATGNEIRILTKSGASATGAASAITVRRVSVGAAGATATSETAQPLFLIDGKKASKAEMDRLAPAAIASVEVIKGPAATAQFGAEGANGVVMITTKR